MNHQRRSLERWVGLTLTDELDFLFYIDKADGPGRGMSASEKRDLKEALEGLHGQERRQKEFEIKHRWQEIKEAEQKALKYAQQGEARAIWESKIKRIRAAAQRNGKGFPPKAEGI
jgi:hypothetical protein